MDLPSINLEFINDVETAISERNGRIFDKAFYSLPEETQKAVRGLLLEQSLRITTELRAIGVTPSYVALGSGTFGSLHLTSKLMKKDMVQSVQ